jgi:hypothetical protein
MLERRKIKAGLEFVKFAPDMFTCEREREREREKMVVVTTMISPTEHEHFSSFR